MRNKELKVRLSETEYSHFTEACEKDQVATSTKARELIVNFSQSVLGQAVKEAACPNEAGEKMPVLVPGRALRVGEMFSGPGGIGTALNRAKSKNFSFEQTLDSADISF